MASITSPAAATHVLVVQIGSGSTVVVVVEVEVVVGIVQLISFFSIRSARLLFNSDSSFKICSLA